MSCPPIFRILATWTFKTEQNGNEGITFAVSGLFVLGGCSPSTQEHSLKGIVADATMNTVSVVENGDTLSFGTANADKEGLDGLFIGDSVEVCYRGKYASGMEALQLSTIAHPEAVVRTRLFEEGLRTEAIDGSSRSLYILFSPDSLTAELYTSDKEEKEIWKQHTLPSGKHFWSLKDENDPVTLHRAAGRWTVTDREKVLFEQPQSDADESLGIGIPEQGRPPFDFCQKTALQVHPFRSKVGHC